MITVESICYMPTVEDLDSPLMSKETPAYVTDYTFHVFSLYTDIIVDLLFRQNATFAVEKDYPDSFGKILWNQSILWA